MSKSLSLTQRRLKTWLFESALPRWCEHGIDRTNGGVFEALNQSGRPHDVNRRTRVAARQVYVYALATQMGYQGEVNPVIDAGLGWLTGPAAAPDGTLYSVVSASGKVIAPSFDLYDHAFALLAYATAFRARRQDQDLENRALAIRDLLITAYKHPVRGFEEGRPRALPLKSNPHMHMFEACLAWIDSGGDTVWRGIALEIADLCLDKFIDRESGALREYFDGDWSPIEGERGRIIEPGHQFEWAWLLVRWAHLTGDRRYLNPARRLVEIGERHGTISERNATVYELWDDFTIKDQRARLWAQTERIKAYVALHAIAESATERGRHIDNLILACEGLEKFLQTPVQGLYRDMLNPDGTFVEEPAPASSLYHIICAIDELLSVPAD